MTLSVRQLVNQADQLEKSLECLEGFNNQFFEASRLNRIEAGNVESQRTETYSKIWEALRHLEGNYFLCDETIIILDRNQRFLYEQVRIIKPTVVTNYDQHRISS